jgi:hypothetical protein
MADHPPRSDLLQDLMILKALDALGQLANETQTWERIAGVISRLLSLKATP